MIVLDTNVLSELMKPAERRSGAVVNWMREQPAETVFTTTITLAEILAGIAIVPAGKRKQDMQAVAERIFATIFSGRILPFDESAARLYAEIITLRRKAGVSTEPLDIQIAAIARARGMAVATRNVSDFEDADIEVIDPWSS